jgi:hypothetical protein
MQRGTLDSFRNRIRVLRLWRNRRKVRFIVLFISIRRAYDSLVETRPLSPKPPLPSSLLFRFDPKSKRPMSVATRVAVRNGTKSMSDSVRIVEHIARDQCSLSGTESGTESIHFHLNSCKIWKLLARRSQLLHHPTAPGAHEFRRLSRVPPKIEATAFGTRG